MEAAHEDGLSLNCKLVPVVVVGVTLLLPALPTHVTEGLIMPDIGADRCFISADGVAMLAYLHVYVAPCLGYVLVVFGLTSWALTVGKWAPKDKNSSTQSRQSNLLTLVKLFFALGLPWTAEVTSFALGYIYNDDNATNILVQKISAPLDLINASQGILVFLVVFLGPILAVAIVGGYGFVVWMSQLIFGLPGSGQ